MGNIAAYLLYWWCEDMQVSLHIYKLLYECAAVADHQLSTNSRAAAEGRVEIAEETFLVKGVWTLTFSVFKHVLNKWLTLVCLSSSF